jgi:hypothetical protein
MRRNLAQSLHDAIMHGLFTFCCVSRSEVFAKKVSALPENVSSVAQFSRQIVIQILSLESPKENHAVCSLYLLCVVMSSMMSHVKTHGGGGVAIHSGDPKQNRIHT